MQAPLVSIEVHLSAGLPAFSMVGLPEKAVKESRDRVRSALLNNDFCFPMQRITVSLAPADLPKEGGRFDLPIALGIMAANGDIDPSVLDEYEFAGELALTGALRCIKGALPFAMATRAQQKRLIMPNDNAKEAGLVAQLALYPAAHLVEVVAHLQQTKALASWQAPVPAESITTYPDLSDVKGQPLAKRALEIAACGGHSMLLQGPPGTGKSMLAQRLPGILPELSLEQALESAAVYSISMQAARRPQLLSRPFRSPHHTASSVALVGGGSPPKPGEISLAHHGVLFLDELPEFSRNVLEALREPMETGEVCISRAACQAVFPAKFQLIAAMNPCPCGYLTDPKKSCRCSAEHIARYQAKISGPLLDRIDIQLEVPRISTIELLTRQQESESSRTIRARVIKGHQYQFRRQQKNNAWLSHKELWRYCGLDHAARQFLYKAVEQLNLSARACHKVLRVARTIADLSKAAVVEKKHLEEAFIFRFH